MIQFLSRRVSWSGSTACKMVSTLNPWPLPDQVSCICSVLLCEGHYRIYPATSNSCWFQFGLQPHSGSFRYHTT